MNRKWCKDEPAPRVLSAPIAAHRSPIRHAATFFEVPDAGTLHVRICGAPKKTRGYPTRGRDTRGGDHGIVAKPLNLRLNAQVFRPIILRVAVTGRVKLVTTEVAKRSVSGTVGHVLMLCVALTAAPNALGLPVGFVAGVFAFALAIRFYASRRSLTKPESKHNLALLAAGSIGCNLVWGLAVGCVEVRTGAGVPAVIYAFFLCGIACGSVAALAPSAGIQRISLAVLTLPGVVAATTGYGVPAFGALHAIFFFYTIMLGTVAGREFWATVSANEQLREAAAAEKRVAEQLRVEIAQRLQMEIELRPGAEARSDRASCGRNRS